MYLQLIGIWLSHISIDLYEQREGLSLLIIPRLRGTGLLPIVKLKIIIVKIGKRQTNSNILKINIWFMLI